MVLFVHTEKKKKQLCQTAFVEPLIAYIPLHYLSAHYLWGSKVIVGALVDDSRQLP